MRILNSVKIYTQRWTGENVAVKKGVSACRIQLGGMCNEMIGREVKNRLCVIENFQETEELWWHGEFYKCSTYRYLTQHWEFIVTILYWENRNFAVFSSPKNCYLKIGQRNRRSREKDFPWKQSTPGFCGPAEGTDQRGSVLCSAFCPREGKPACVHSNGQLAGLEKDELGKAVSMCYYLLAAIRIGNHLWHSGDNFVTLTVMLLCTNLTHRKNP